MTSPLSARLSLPWWPCAEQGNSALLRLVCESSHGAQNLNAGASKGHSPLMRACQQGCAPGSCCARPLASCGFLHQSLHRLLLLLRACEGVPGNTPSSALRRACRGVLANTLLVTRACRSQRHVECVAYLLAAGADAHAQSSRGDNALHVAAKHGSAGCLAALLGHRPPGDTGSTALLGDLIVQGDAGPTRFINLHNGVRRCLWHTSSAFDVPFIASNIPQKSHCRHCTHACHCCGNGPTT